MEMPESFLSDLSMSLIHATSMTKDSSTVISHHEIQAAHRSAVSWWLNHRLMQVNKLHAKMQRIRLGQKLEREIKQVSKYSHSILVFWITYLTHI